MPTPHEHAPQSRKPATREEFFVRTQEALFHTKRVLEMLRPIIDAENKYLEQTAADMGIKHHHIK